MNIIELAKQVDIDSMPADYNYRTPYFAGTEHELETFARLVIEAHVKGVDMEPAIRESIAGNVIAGYTATQMAAVRQRALEEAAAVCDSLASVEGIAQQCAAAIRALGVKA